MNQPYNPRVPFEPNKEQKDKDQENAWFGTDYESDPEHIGQPKDQTIGKDFNEPKPE